MIRRLPSPPLSRSEFTPIAQMAVALWLASSLFWGMPDLLASGRLPLRVGLAILFDCALGLGLCAVFLAILLRLRGWGALLRGAATAALVVTLAMLHAYADARAMLWLNAASGFTGGSALKIFGSILIDYMLIYALFATAVSLLLSQFAIRQRDQRLALAESTAQRAQLAALRHQLNPHFVFNTLNAIGSLVATGRSAQAEEMIARFSDFFRSSLDADARPFATLEDELATIQTCLDIETVRFGDRLRIVYDYPAEAARAWVPSFLLQPLVDNAVKHAVGPAMRPVTVRLAAWREGEMLAISIEDTGAGPDRDPTAPRAGTGTGLANARERLRLLYGARGSLEAGPKGEGYAATVRLPFDTMPPAPGMGAQA